MYESAALNTDNSISSKLKYYRKINGLTRRQLEIQANIPMNSIKNMKIRIFILLKKFQKN